MSRDKTVIDYFLHNRPNLECVKEYFLEHWAAIDLIGPVNYFSLTPYLGLGGDNTKEELLAWWLLGSAKILNSRDREGGPPTAQTLWEEVLYLLDVLLPEGFKVERPEIRVIYTVEGGAE